MKTTKYIALIITATMFFTACSDFLSPTSLSNFDGNYVFSNSGDAKKMVMGVYALFAQDSYTSRMSAVWMQNTDVEASVPGALPDGTRRDIWSLQPGGLSSFGDIKTAWDHNYLAIDRANQCIEGIQKSAIASQKDMKMLLGESYCLRAYRYFLLCNFWGDVPYFRKAADATMPLDVPRTDKNIIYSGIIQDLVNCESDMYFADEYSDGIERMNREFALGMIARLSLFRAGYGMTASGTMKRADDYLDVAHNDSLAVTYTIDGVKKVARTYTDYYQLVKDYTQKLIALKPRLLNPNYATIFLNECQWIKPVNDDVLYEVAFGNTNGGGDVGWCIGVPVTASSKGTTTIQVGLTPSYYFSFDQKDVRRDATISKVQYSSDTEQGTLGITSLATNKWNRLLLTTSPGSTSSKGTGINWPLMRYSDVLLMLAEAENQLNGPTDLAKQMLTTVRTRAFKAVDYSQKVQAYIDSVSTSKDVFFNALVNERAWEFGGECLRKFDLVRWNNYGQKIIETRATLDNIGKAALGLELTKPEVAKYVSYAKSLYYIKANGTITFLNSYYEPTTAQINNWTTTYGSVTLADWSKSLYAKLTATDGSVTYQSANFTTYSWRGYTDLSGTSAVPYLLPISSQTIATSIFLNNNGYLLSSK
jgi:hypothetical protein